MPRRRPRAKEIQSEVMEAVSKNGSLYTLERVRDENGFFLADDGENSLLIEPADWGFYEIKGGEGHF